MMTRVRGFLLSVIFAVAATTAALYLRLLLDPYLGHRLPFITLYPAIAIAVWLGGWRPAVLAAMLGYAGAYRMIISTESGSPLILGGSSGEVGMLAYLGTCLILIFLGNRMRVARRRAEAKARELELITNTMPLQLARYDRDRRFIWANRPCADLLGCGEHEIAGRPIAEILGEEFADTLEPHIERVLKGETVEFEMELPYAYPGRTCMIIYTPDRDERGKVIGWIGSIADVTRQRKLVQRESENLLRVITDGIPALILPDTAEGKGKPGKGAELIPGLPEFPSGTESAV